MNNIAPVTEDFQKRVQPWMMACFGAAIAADKVERNHRFFEEATEAVQANGMTRSEAHQLVDYTFNRPVGELHQEVGGVMVTLAALCLASGEDMHAAGETELARIWTKVEQIRAKQAAKPKHSPLPAAATLDLATASETLRNAVLAGNTLAIGMVMGLRSLVKKSHVQIATVDAAPSLPHDAWKAPFDERHQFDVYPDHFMTGMKNEFCAGWHAALKTARDSSKSASARRWLYRYKLIDDWTEWRDSDGPEEPTADQYCAQPQFFETRAWYPAPVSAAQPVLDRDRYKETRDKWKIVDGDCREGANGLITYHVDAFDEGYGAGVKDTRELAAMLHADDINATRNSEAAQDVLAERRRQVATEGWTPEHDDEHDAGVLAAAASAYALYAADELNPHSLGDGDYGRAVPAMWPFSQSWWKPEDDRKALVKAGALILAEIERYDRAASAPKGDGND